MLSVIIATLRLALTPLTIAKAMLENLDTNKEGLDDKLADGLGKAIDLIVSFVATDDGVAGQARGLVAITAFCAKNIGRLKAIVATEPPYSEAERIEAQTLHDELWNNDKVYQAQRGKDAEVLAAAQAEAKDLLGIVLQS